MNKYAMPFLGVEGDIPHLKKHGGHTPWRAGSPLGIVWALDTDPGDEFGPFFIALCQSDYETRWVRFWNFRGRQYDCAGNDLGSSGDHHLHLEVEDGWQEYANATLFDDYFASKEGPMFTIKQLLDTVIPSSNGNLDVKQRLKDATTAQQTVNVVAKQVDSLTATVAKQDARLIEIASKVNDIVITPAPEIDYSRLAKAIVDEAIVRNGTP
jgi:hypothetical protein